MKAPITAIVTAYSQIEQTLVTISKIKSCCPEPSEILVHVDGNQHQCQKKIERQFPDIKVILSKNNIGPGGGRNKLINKANYNLIASFDDDSYPLDSDYFSRLLKLFTDFPDASIIGAKLYHPNEEIEDLGYDSQWVADFAGGACAYRKKAFLETSGYVPLTIAYGMEEVDLAIRLHSQGYRILYTNFIRVFHDSDRKHHEISRVTSISLANLALLAFLRYPVLCWILGLLQIVNRIIWLLKNQRFSGIWAGILMIPPYLWIHRKFRKIVSTSVLLSYISLKQKPKINQPIERKKCHNI